ncbi:laminin subunit alpha-2-like isoform X2 [Pollicipes pollicipes]|uniref:laminin subunit alpha-2-like isoform X2 n=1 Tax=Pollicipes pollicipes TaxID=41117 RepID=UPI00188596B5|nr:laminin subunit alpha-2-like isoform X2 [Pollicipes pollicipes]
MGRRSRCAALLLCAALVTTQGVAISTGSEALYPNIFNLAPGSDVSVNATCGTEASETFCELSSIVYMTDDDCQICDAFSSDAGRRHPIENIIDGTDAWWQGPTLEQGMQYQWITIEIDLKQEYEVAYVILKTAGSPAPGTWVLERSLKGDIYEPWQFFAGSDSGCRDHFGMKPTSGKPKYRSASDVICTSYFSKLNPLSQAEIYVPLITGRPTSESPSAELLEFVRARYVRLRLQAVLSLNSHLLAFSGGYAEPDVLRSYFYSLRDVTIGGRCACHGHAEECPLQQEDGTRQCLCTHNTCGATCDECCPLYNQRPWSPGSAFPGTCEPCQCYGHADECYFDDDVARGKKSVNIAGHHEGGGVCLNCQHFTAGINCESCLAGYFRPAGLRPDDPQPCRRCQCTAPGATGLCVQDDSRLTDGQVPGACICKEGFAGERCDRCARGYQNYPECEPCPCDEAGTLDAECEGQNCLCKPHVRGQRCDSCKPGYYNLQADNPDGCTECFCFGLTSICTSSFLGVENVTTIVPWTVTSLDGSMEVQPYLDGTTQLVANDEMSDLSGYYWQAPQELLGLRVYSYGQTMQFETSWVVRRGDTAGRPVKGPDIILEGAGLRLGYGHNMYHGGSASISAPLNERSWYRMSTKVNDIVRKKREKYVRGPVTRRQLMRVLGSMDRLLVRAKYHSDQIEGGLHDFVLKIASESSVSSERTTAVEQCQCPPGYAGYSCERCDFGYRRRNGTLFRGECVPCDCNSHAESCDPFSGQCGACLHNTMGDSCELCAPGYYGNARRGTPDACRPCACPTELVGVDFTPSCEATPGGEDYVCTSCPPGHDGDHCERCGAGHYGSPLAPGGGCRPCQCGGNVDPSDPAACDPLTGECLACRGHTAGWHCDVCEDGFFGDAAAQQCRPCECGMFGSTSPVCDHVTGQCPCKERFIGEKCDRCQNPGGNIEADCLECFCDLAGSLGPLCDPGSGQCQCRAGVEGTNCSRCLPDHFGFGAEGGCRVCQCHPVGAEGKRCDLVTGACSCRPRVTGRSCDRCQDGFFGLESGAGCRPCDCDPAGSLRDACDPVTGRCRCKPGVGGERCTACLPGHFRMGESGCQECGPCSQPGHLCDPMSGQCVCPPNTAGAACESCLPGHWGWNNLAGCQPCECDRQGSRSGDCDRITGRCSCFDGFGGRRCDQCQPGFYNFPVCQACRCDPEGSANCDEWGNCPCDESGQCQCKTNVRGDSCDRCVDGTFGMSADNPDGCTACFCFTRSGQCSQAEFSWVPLTLPDSRAVTLSAGQTRLNVTNTLRVIPGFSGDVRLGLNFPFDAPVYWQLPPEFLGDKVRSYNGHLRFRSRSTGGSRPFPASILSSYPLVQLQGNYRLVLEHFPPTTQPDGFYQVKLHESFWRVKGDRRALVTREMLMVALQNTQHVLIRATELIDATRAELSDVSWDIAEPTYGHSGSTAVGIERCACPKGYNGSSCQDPSIGFYRTFTPGFSNSEIIIDLVGESVPCQCNDRSEVCDSDTGHCQNCTDNTAGEHCEVCAAGFYGDPDTDTCRPCLCPSIQLSNAQTCVTNYRGGFRCECDPGYTGERCDRCAFGYFGSALDRSADCQQCGCDPAGSVSATCDPDSGVCQCRPGVVGRDCTRCAERHVLTEQGCQACQDGCVERMFEDVDQMAALVVTVNLTGAGGAPWRKLYNVTNVTERHQEELEQYTEGQLTLRALLDTMDLTKFANTILINVEDLVQVLPSQMNEARDIRNEIDSIYQSALVTKFEAEETVAQLLNYAIGETSSAGVEKPLAEAEALLASMLRRDLTPALREAEAEQADSRRLLERVRAMLLDGPVLAESRQRLERLRQRLLDAALLVTDGVSQPVSEVEVLIRTLREKQDSLASSRQQIQQVGDMCEQRLSGSSDIQRRTRRLYDDGKGSLIDLRDMQFQLNMTEERLRRRTDGLNQLTDDYRVRHVIPAQVHAARLTSEADRLVSLFQATRQEADLSLQAAEAYQNIVDALNSARQAAKDASQAAQNAYEQAYPRYTDSLVSLGTQAKTMSEALSEQADDLRHQVVALSDQVATSAAGMIRVNGTLRTAGSVNDDVRNFLSRNSHSELTSAARGAIALGQAALDTASAALRRTERVQGGIETRLLPGLQRLRAGGRDGLGNVTGIIASARRNIGKANIRAQAAEERLDELRVLDDTVSLKLESLRNKILKARQAATNIRVSLTDQPPPSSCSRTYRAPQLQPSTASSIRLNYAISDPATRDALLIYLPSETQKDYMAVEMVNRRIRFTWNNGDQSQRVEHPRRLQTNNDQLMNDQHWYIIEAERIGGLGRLSVRPASGGSGRLPLTVANTTGDGFSIMDLTPADLVYVGGLPEDADSGIRTKKFAGCLYEAMVNGKPLGLWNFASSQGCGACRAGPSSDDATTSSGYSFSGAGYAELPPLRPGQVAVRGMYSVVMNVRTFDSDALLFLAVNAEKDQFFSLEMRNGNLVSRVGFSKEDVLVVSTNGKYNTGNWTMVEATKVGNRVILKANHDEDKESAFHPESSSDAPPRSFNLALDTAKLYFGGVPPDFRQSRWPQHTFVPLLGCMDDLQVGFTPQNLRVGNSTGVTPGCGGQLLKTVGFHGDGYLETNSYRLRKMSSFAFSFKTTASDGLLLMSTFADKAMADSAMLREYYALSLNASRLTLRINGGSGELVLTAADLFSDGRFHTVHVLKERRRVELRVADAVAASGQLPRGSSGVQAPNAGGLYFGGLPPGLRVPFEGVPPPFSGCITDVIFEEE